MLVEKYGLNMTS